MEAIETLLKMIGLLLVYGMLFILFVTICVFLLIVAGIHYIARLFGLRKNDEEGEGKK